MKKIIMERESGKKYLLKECNHDFNTSFGVLKKKDIQSQKKIIYTDKGTSFFLVDARFPDLWEQLHPGPQKIIQKDIGLILARTGVNKESVVVDAGGGIGSLALSLANIVKRVVVYENNSEHVRILEKNIQLCSFKNITVKKDTIYEGILEKNIDVITLDLSEPWRVTLHAEKSLKNGGFIVVYLPNLN